MRAPARGPVPLARLLAMAYRDLIDQLHRRLADEGWPAARPAYGFVLLAASRQPMTVSEVGALLGVTKQAASKLVGVLVAEGLLARVPTASDARAKVLQLSVQGEEFLATVESIYADLEADWANVVGAGRLEDLRADLLAVLHHTHGETLPPIRPTW